MGRNRPLPPFDEWQVTTNPFGQWIIVGPDGEQPLKHPDRVVRLHAIYTASQATALRMCVSELLRVVNYLRAENHGYVPLVEFAHLTLRFTRPPDEILNNVVPIRNQAELDLEAA